MALTKEEQWKKEKIKKYQRNYHKSAKARKKELDQRPEAIVKRKAYNQREDVKAKRREYEKSEHIIETRKRYRQSPKGKAMHKKSQKRWRAKPENKELLRKRSQLPEVKARKKEAQRRYSQKPEVKEKIAERTKKYYENEDNRQRRRVTDNKRYHSPEGQRKAKEYRESPKGSVYHRNYSRVYTKTEKAKTRMKKYASQPHVKEKILQKSRKPESRERNAANRVMRRYELIWALGGECVECKTTDIRLLHIDHIHGGGRQEKYSTPSTDIDYIKYRRNINEAKNKLQILCTNHNKIKRFVNQEGIKYLDSKTGVPKESASWSAVVRYELTILLGGKCIHCGINDIRALELDHINGEGKKNRKFRRADTEYNYYKKNIDEAKNTLQVLCANHNKIKRYENKEGIRYLDPKTGMPRLMGKFTRL